MSLRTEVSSAALELLLGVRDGVGEARLKEFSEYVKSLIEAKKNELDVSVLQLPMLTDTVRQGVEVSLAKKSNLGVEGGVAWTIANISGRYSNEKAESMRAKVDMSLYAADKPDTDAMKEWSVEELERLLNIVEAE